MAFEYLTGRAGPVRRAVSDFVRAKLGASEGAVILLVPAQWTLQAEMDALALAAPEGSFRLMVFSPTRLYARVFDQTGWPGEARVDAQGRVMLTQAAARRHQNDLKWYAGAVAGAGFAQRAQKQIEVFKQAGLTPHDLRTRAQETQDDGLRAKLSDLALLYDAYERALEGRFMDGEDEAARAVAKMPAAPFLKGASVLVYGFDLISPTLARTIAGLCASASSVTLAINLENNEKARDWALYEPVLKSLELLLSILSSAGVEATRVALPDDLPKPNSGIAHLERELFTLPPHADPLLPKDVQLVMARNPGDEATLAAAISRRLARKRGYRYRDIAVALMTEDAAYESELRRAFALQGVPLFLAGGRGADKHPLSVFVLRALRAVTRGYASRDMALYLRSGFAGLTPEETDILINYMERRGLKGQGWTRPLKWGDPEEIEEAEPLREKAVTPLLALAVRLKEAKNVRDLMTGVYRLMEELDVFPALEAMGERLKAEGLPESATEGAQVLGRILSAMDQAVELLGEEKIPSKEAAELLERALSAAEVKPLPQSGDAVEAGGVSHLKGKRLKALIVVGASDAQGQMPDMLLDAREKRALSQARTLWLGQDAQELAAMRSLSIKSLLALPENYLLVTWPQSDASGAAQAQSRLVRDIKAALPKLTERGGVSQDDLLDALRLESAQAARSRAPALQKAGSPVGAAALEALSALEDAALADLSLAARLRVESEPLAPELARRAFGDLQAVSASRLEQYAACPFAHFVRYALRPEEFRPFELSPRDAGTFYHEALSRFVDKNARRLGRMDAKESLREMDGIADSLLDALINGAAGESALTRTEISNLKSVARRAAQMLVRQFDGSRFVPVGMEADIARGEVRLRETEPESVMGRIDRVDVFEDQDARYVRVVDYKTGGREFSLAQTYYGLQMQLVVYLAAAVKQLGGVPVGAFYFSVSDPVLDTPERNPEAVETLRAEALRMDGPVLADTDVIGAMGSLPENVIHVSFKKDGSLSKVGERALAKEDFERLIDHTLRMAYDMLTQIRSGNTEIAPAKIGNRCACDYCPSATVCQFDERLPGAITRMLPNMRASQVLEKLQSEAVSTKSEDSGTPQADK